MRGSLPVAIGDAPGPEILEDLRFLVEIDRRRASIGVHTASDLTRPARVSTTLWLDAERAERLGQDILATAAALRSAEVLSVDRLIAFGAGPAGAQ